MSTRILFLSKGTNSSSSRYRALQYFSLYIESGFQPSHITISGGLTPFFKALYHASKSDIVILVRKTFPSPLFWLLRKVSKKLIFDFDDAIFCNTDGSYSKTRMERFINTVSQCDYVFAGNRYLAETTQKFQTKTTVIPTSLDTQKYNQQIVNKDHDFTLVWIGSKSTKKFIVTILPSIELAAQSIPNLTLKIIADFELHSDLLCIKNIPWEESTEAYEVASSDVGLGPLPEDNWTKGKCALKVLQYMSASIPVISSPTGANQYVIDHLKSGYLAEDDLDWVSYIKTAFQQKNKLKQMGEFGKQRVLHEFDINVVFRKILPVIKSIEKTL